MLVRQAATDQGPSVDPGLGTGDVGPWRTGVSRAQTRSMLQTSASAQELTREESLALLPSVPVGRLVFTERALPAVIPVNFLVDHGRIVLRTGATSSLTAAVRGSVVAFEVDQIDPEARQGWSVVVTGRASEVRDALELDRLKDLPLLPWVGGQVDHFVVISIELVNGRRIGGRPWTASR